MTIYSWGVLRPFRATVYFFWRWALPIVDIFNPFRAVCIVQSKRYFRCHAGLIFS